MQALILAGGQGTRLLPITENIPKAMVSINNKPFLSYLLRLLADNQINEIILATGYLGEKIREYYGNRSEFGQTIEYTIEKELMGTAASIKLAEDQLDAQFFIINGDTYLDAGYKDIYNKFSECPDKGLMVVYDNKENTLVKLDCSVDLQGRISLYAKGSNQPCLKYVWAGIAMFKKEVLKHIPGNTVTSLETNLFPALIRKGSMRAYITEKRFFDIGTELQRKEFEEYIIKQSTTP